MNCPYKDATQFCPMYVAAHDASLGGRTCLHVNDWENGCLVDRGADYDKMLKRLRKANPEAVDQIVYECELGKEWAERKAQMDRNRVNNGMVMGSSGSGWWGGSRAANCDLHRSKALYAIRLYRSAHRRGHSPRNLHRLRPQSIPTLFVRAGQLFSVTLHLYASRSRLCTQCARLNTPGRNAEVP